MENFLTWQEKWEDKYFRDYEVLRQLSTGDKSPLARQENASLKFPEE